MENNGENIMVVVWEKQRRQIKIKVNDDLNSIEERINQCYHLKQGNQLHEYQIQYYDSNYQNFMDLYPESFGEFQQILRKLFSSEAPPRSAKEWMLKIVPKTIQTTRRTIRESIITDDTYNYQQENDPIDLQNEEPITTNLRSSALPDVSTAVNPETLPRDPMSQNIDEDEEETTQPNCQSLQLNTDHPYGLGFDSDLADRQRQQYEKEMCRTGSSNSSKGGVRLRACSKPTGTSSSDKSYPVVHFKISNDKHNLEWFIVLSILTEADSHGIHYLHSSKGIYHGQTARESRCGTIRDSESVNPYVVRLTRDQLRDGKFEILIKVCNMRDVSTRRKEKLLEFSRSCNPKNYDQLTLSSTNTMGSLQFANERYHLGCTLICGEMIYDQCISNLTIAVPNQKRNDNGQTNQQDGESKKKKK